MSTADVTEMAAFKKGVERAETSVAEARGDDIAPWVERIRPHLERTVESILAAGKELAAAKEALPHGRFGPLLAQLGLSADMAQRFMRVARNPVLSNPERAPHLPPSIETLKVLARLDDDELTEAVESGEITPTTTRAEAEDLARRRKHDAAAEIRALHAQRRENVRELADSGLTARQIARELDIPVDWVRSDAEALGFDRDHPVLRRAAPWERTSKAKNTTNSTAENTAAVAFEAFISAVSMGFTILGTPETFDFEALAPEVRAEAFATLVPLHTDLGAVVEALAEIEGDS